MYGEIEGDISPSNWGLDLQRIRDRPTCLAGPRPWAGQAARRVRNVATLQWEPSAMGHPGINVHARALAMECSNRGQVIWLAMMGKRAQVQPHEPGE